MHQFASPQFLKDLQKLVPEISVDRPDPTPQDVDKAEKILRSGNNDYSANGVSAYPGIDQISRDRLVNDQWPIAAILCCSDSRVPPEIVHWQGLGMVFVIREAGHVLDLHGQGSIHYAIQHLKVPLLVVLGHQRCGAVSAAVQTVGQGAPLPDGPLGNLVGAIIPAVRAVWTEEAHPEVVLERCVKEHTRRTAEILGQDAVIANQIGKGAMRIIEGYYELRTGAVIYT